jgi:polyphosphate kinase 2
MAKLRLSEDDLAVLNSKIGLKQLLADSKVDVEKALRLARYELRLRELQAELITLQQWVIEEGKKVVILFEGRDAAGKGGAIRRLAAHINPRHYRIMALPKPSEEERGQWYFQRYINLLPKAGEIVFFDRSWYNRAIVEPVNGFCTPQEYEIFMEQVNSFEQMIQQSGTYLIKLWFSITKEEQANRFKEIRASAHKRWKMTEVDEQAQELWDQYTVFKERMLEKTNLPGSPWVIIQANRKTEARTEATEYILNTIPFPRK